MLVSIGDREADIYELFHEAAKDPSGPKLLIRAERARKRKVIDEDKKEDLWKRMEAEPVAGLIDVAVPRRGSRPSRTAKLQVRFAHVMLNTPSTSKLPPLYIWVVSAREVGYPMEVTEPIDWVLLTSINTESFEDACERLSWYSRRWGIEVYHRTIKSGCRIEDRRLDDAQAFRLVWQSILWWLGEFTGLRWLGEKNRRLPVIKSLAKTNGMY